MGRTSRDGARHPDLAVHADAARISAGRAVGDAFYRDAAHHTARRADADATRDATLRRRGALMADSAKVPQRSTDQIAGDIAGERAQLGKALTPCAPT